MPPAQNGEYEIYSCVARRCGQRELLAVLYTVGVNWHKLHPSSQLDIGDMNAGSPHASHKWGVAVDVVTTDGSAADTSGSSARSTELAKLFVDTNLIKNIWYCDSVVDSAVLAYAREKNLSLEQMYCIDGHYDHFHIDINIPRGPEHTPYC